MTDIFMQYRPLWQRPEQRFGPFGRILYEKCDLSSVESIPKVSETGQDIFSVVQLAVQGGRKHR
jgi:hypothetical protein